MNIGANYIRNGECDFSVWLPFADQVELKIIEPQENIYPMESDERGYWKVKVKNIADHSLYLYRINNQLERPDPASNYQPMGVHKPSQVIDHSTFKWTDKKWKGKKLQDYVIYELHIGTFTQEGTYNGVIQKLKELKKIGISAIELMPISQFPGNRNWGYDGVHPFAPQNSYGKVNELKELINECHNEGLAVILDVVYNHFGPEGNYSNDFGPYFTGNYRTPWGDAVNFDSEYSDEVRNFFYENALYWFKNFHFDALRLDAVHSIFDMSAKHFLEELSELTEKFSSQNEYKRYLIAESDLNDDKIIRPRKLGGYGCDAQWSDDFHHSLHAFLTKESLGYYLDFGKLKHLAEAIKNGYVYSGKYSKFRKRRHGNNSNDRPGYRFIISTQNHDQVGNRAFGERLSNLISFEKQKLAAALLLISPYIPMFFMGEEYGEDNPFLYFVSHIDPELIKSVQIGRRKEFEAFKWQGEVPDPQSTEAFQRSKLDWNKKVMGHYKILLNWHKELLKLRKSYSPLKNFNRNDTKVKILKDEKVLLIERKFRKKTAFALFNFYDDKIKIKNDFGLNNLIKVIDSHEEKWGSSGSSLKEKLNSEDQIILEPSQFVLYFNS